MARPKVHDDALRVRLLEHAARLLSEEGAEALSLRRLAREVGTSTTAVYSLFGGKPELLRAVHAEAFRRFAGHLGRVAPSGDARADLAALAEAYRASATSDPHLYAVMFGPRAVGVEPTPESLSTFEPLVEAVRRGVESGQLPDADPETLAAACWATVHGLVSLELAGHLPEEAAADLFTATTRAVTSGWGRG